MRDIALNFSRPCGSVVCQYNNFLCLGKPANCKELTIQRILVRHGVSRDLGSLLLADMKWAIEYFEQHPVQTHMSADEASGFHH